MVLVVVVGTVPVTVGVVDVVSVYVFDVLVVQPTAVGSVTITAIATPPMLAPVTSNPVSKRFSISSPLHQITFVVSSECIQPWANPHSCCTP